MFNKKILFCIFILALSLAGCGPAKTPIPTVQPFPKLAGDWTVKLTQSGGIMGMLRTVEIRSNGKLHIEDKRGNKQSTDRELSASQMKQLIDLVNSSKLVTPREPSAACADCFIYDLQITTNGQTFSTQLNDISLPDSGLESIVRFLSDLMSV